jgi:response regulator RpfG family c-di-GMP phosphodiesterase
VDKYNILVVDDQVNNLDALERLLKPEYNIFSATSGEDALAIMEQNDVALIIADQRMPGMSGAELLEMVSKKHPATIRLILTEYIDVKSLLNDVNPVSAHGFLAKPWESQAVTFTVRKWIEAHEALDKLGGLEEKAGQSDNLQRQLEEARDTITELTRQFEQSQRVADDYHQVPWWRRWSKRRGEDRKSDEDKTKEQLIAELVELRKENAELHKEVGDFEAAEIDFVRRVRIGEVLVDMGCLTSSQLQRTVQKQRESDILRHKRLGDIMIQQGLITMEERDDALAEQYRRRDSEGGEKQ